MAPNLNRSHKFNKPTAYLLNHGYLVISFYSPGTIKWDTTPFLSNTVKAATSVINRVHHKEAWVGWVSCRALTSSYGRGLYSRFTLFSSHATRLHTRLTELLLLSALSYLFICSHRLSDKGFWRVNFQLNSLLYAIFMCQNNYTVYNNNFSIRYSSHTTIRYSAHTPLRKRQYLFIWYA